MFLFIFLTINNNNNRPFDVELENDHVIQRHQVFVGIIPQGPDGKKLNSSYKFRSTAEYQVSLGNTVVNLSRIIPNGLLVFFPSYPVMDMVVAKWEVCWNSSFISSSKHKKVSETSCIYSELMLLVLYYLCLTSDEYCLFAESFTCF